MLQIGLTGGIGSGKSTVASIFKILNIPVLSSDDVAKELMINDKAVREAIITIFGSEAYLNNQLNKSFISNIVFSQGDKLEKLNEIVHPATIAFANYWALEQKAPYVIKETALLFESKSNLNTDYIIGVKASLETRIKRCMSRSKISREAVLIRIANQMNEEIKLSLCDFIISNEENDLLIIQVLDLHEKFIYLSKQNS